MNANEYNANEEKEAMEETQREKNAQESNSDDDGVEIPVNVQDGDDEGSSDQETVDGSDRGESEDEDLFLDPEETEDEVVELSDDESDDEEGEQDGAEAQGGEAEGDSGDDGDDDSEDDGVREELEAEIERLEGRVEELEEERDDFQNRMLRAAADLENYRKRAKRELKEEKKYGIEKVVDEMLPAIDNLERALEHARESDEEANIVDGVEMVLRQILTALEKHGVEQFDATGEKFNPELHEAIQQVSTPDAESGTVLEQFQKGYKLHDRLLRPAMVSVAKKSESSDNGADGEQETSSDQEASSEQNSGDES